VTFDHAELAAREEIRALISRYCVAADAGRLDEVVGLFTASGHIEFRGEKYARVEGIHEMFVDSGRRIRAGGLRGRLMHTVTTIDIELADGAAQGSSCFQVLSASGLDHWGRYADEYVVEDGRWRFSRRTIAVEGRVPGGFGDVLA
jgi:hypothetical protein